VILNKAFQTLEPEKRNAGQDFPFIRDGVVHYHVKRGHPVACDDQELVFHFVDISHLTRLTSLRSCKSDFKRTGSDIALSSSRPRHGACFEGGIIDHPGMNVKIFELLG